MSWIDTVLLAAGSLAAVLNMTALLWLFAASTRLRNQHWQLALTVANLQEQLDRLSVQQAAQPKREPSMWGDE